MRTTDAGRPLDETRAAPNSTWRKPNDLVLLRVERERSLLRWRFVWRSGRGDVVVIALSPASGRPIVQITRADDRDVHPRLAGLVADRIGEEIARVGLHRALH